MREQTDGQTDRPTDGQTDRLTDTPKYRRDNCWILLYGAMENSALLLHASCIKDSDVEFIVLLLGGTQKVEDI